MRILITAGPTREPIDPVRYLSNRSSGKMGFAIAAAALEKGHEVVLVSGPVSLTPPPGAEFVPVETAQEMYEAVRTRLAGCDAAVYCAAVSDYRIREVASEKIKKTAAGMTLQLEATPDILGSCRGDFGFRGILMGFAAETENLEENARGKLKRKGCDFLVANDVSRRDIGFDRNENEVLVFSAETPDAAPLSLAKRDKSLIAVDLVAMLEAAHSQRSTPTR